ncbi:glycosyltransferase family 4 protein [Lacrimispora sp. 210928-DFI.3.58]|uniref:glycosyltransferase family 4 protein n=1 Tax=Lacrimispora sp. 210928-DFI.3.58 TaxID=2883214 RepID=UPI001D06D9B2|nr:glycosyltransferase [Lacrimispora sp. 210928-DFI.3.58]MCB7320084.1 glycosyltransferase [Lacrimispora sp. 210928-DFI.3.58]
MRIVFFSAFISPHVKPFCDCLYKREEVDFVYVQTMVLSEERRRMGYDYAEKIPYLIDLSSNKKQQYKMAEEADCVIINTGSADSNIVKRRIIENKLTFFCNERLFKKGIVKFADPKLWKQFFLNQKAHGKNTYLLCLGNFVCKDFESIGFESGKSFKFGYFPEESKGAVYTESEKIRIIWVGRMIGWKQPEIVIEVAKELEKNKINFEINMIGDGPLFDRVRQKCELLNDRNAVHLLKMLPNDEVRKYMEQSDVLLMTSNRQEGWGAVANEALSAGTPVVAFEMIGACHYIIVDGFNGYICRENDIKSVVTCLKKVKSNYSMLRTNACKTIELWNAKIAASRFLTLIERMQELSQVEYYFKSGPLSKA